MKKTLLVLTTALLPLCYTHADESTEMLVSKEWAGYMETLAPLGEQLASEVPDLDDPQMRAELYQQLYSQIARGYFSYIYADTRHPDWMPIFNLAFNWLVPNPDNVYYGTPVDDDGVYRISGYRGTTRYVTLHVGGGMHTLFGFGNHGPTVADYRLNEKELQINDDGFFELIVSPTRPEGYTGNWRKLGKGATYFLLRQSAYDWANEQDWRFAIERLDQPAIKPRPTAAEINAALKKIGAAAANWTKDWLDRDADLINKLIVHDLNGTSGLSTQKYWEGRFDIGADEALILETEVPEQCGYWNIQLGNLLWNALDHINRQSTLNGFSARLDSDGKFRAVISAQDPGVPNWLDNAGYVKGTMFGRWADCSSNPTPTLTKVKVADVRKYLPADTPVVTAKARDKSLRLRRQAAQLRRRW